MDCVPLFAPSQPRQKNSTCRLSARMIFSTWSQLDLPGRQRVPRLQRLPRAAKRRLHPSLPSRWKQTIPLLILSRSWRNRPKLLKPSRLFNPSQQQLVLLLLPLLQRHRLMAPVPSKHPPMHLCLGLTNTSPHPWRILLVHSFPFCLPPSLTRFPFNYIFNWMDSNGSDSFISPLTGMQTDKSIAKKLHFWLQNWFKNHCGDKKLAKPCEYWFCFSHPLFFLPTCQTRVEFCN